MDPLVKKIKSLKNKGLIDTESLAPSIRSAHDKQSLIDCQYAQTHAAKPTKKICKKTSNVPNLHAPMQRDGKHTQAFLKSAVALVENYSGSHSNSENCKPMDKRLANALNTIFPDWLVKRTDFKESLDHRSELSKLEIGAIFHKPSVLRTNEDRDKILGYLKNLGVVNHYNDYCIMRFLVKMEIKNYNIDDQIIKEGKNKDPICILFDGEVENITTGKSIKVDQLIWDIESEPKSECENQY